MTPQERQLVTELFDRLEKLEGTRRDGDAERAIVDGFDRAPNAAYALVQTVLVQDEALKRANARIEELEASLQGEAPREEHGGFLDNMRDMLTGREGGRGSVPSVRPGAAPGEGSSGRWNMSGRSQAPAGGGYYEPQGAPPPPPPSAGGSFLGTAAATAAGVVGGALLMNSIRGMFGPSHGQASSAFDPGLSGGGGRTPWGGGDASNSDLARDAGLGDIGSGGSRSAAYDDDHRAGLFGNNADQDDGNNDSDDGDDIAGGFDSDDSDTA
jgi:uncharacterized protein